jgi:site-specific DNA-cytosine methylase
MAGYKMVGNAVPAYLGYYLAQKIYEDLKSIGIDVEETRLEMVAS